MKLKSRAVLGSDKEELCESWNLEAIVSLTFDERVAIESELAAMRAAPRWHPDSRPTDRTPTVMEVFKTAEVYDAFVGQPGYFYCEESSISREITDGTITVWQHGGRDA